MKATKSTNQGFSASLAQCKRAYEAHFGQPMPTGMTYQAAAQAVVDALGADAGRDFVLAQTNDPTVPYQSEVGFS